jgi:Tol biopolymer transport system component
LRVPLAIGALAFVLSQAFIGAVGAGRSRQAYSCLSFTSDRERYLLDISSGVALPMRAAPVRTERLAFARGQAWTLYLSDAQQQLILERMADGQPFALALDGAVQNAFWSPDEHWLAYAERLGDQQPLRLTLVNLEADSSGAPTLRRVQIADGGDDWAWSPNGRALLLRRYVARAAPSLAIWSAYDERLHALAIDGMFSFWLPDAEARRFAIVSHKNGNDVQLHIADLTGVRVSYPLGTLISHSAVQWSPHGRYLVFLVQVFPRWQVVIVDSDGNWHAVARLAQRGDGLSQPLVYWSEDGETLYYLQDAGESPLQWHWVAYGVAERSYRTVVSNVVKRLYFSPRNAQQVIVTWETAGKRNVALMRLDGSARALLAESADDVGNPYWSYDGKYAALVWATGQGAQRVVRLTVVNAETGAAQTLSQGLWDARDLRWLAGSAGLFFVAVRGNAQGEPIYSAELLIPKTGEQRVLAADKEIIGTALWQGSDIQFWWRSGKTFGVNRHKPSGETVFAHSLPDDGTTPVLSDMYLYAEGSFIVRSPYPQAFPALNGAWLALKVGAQGNERLYIVKADGTWHLVRSELSGLGDPIWSADGVYLAFTQSVNQSEVTLEIVNANGALIRRVEGYGGIFRDVRWSQCSVLD